VGDIGLGLGLWFFFVELRFCIVRFCVILRKNTHLFDLISS
jgi:hypothetical protein